MVKPHIGATLFSEGQSHMAPESQRCEKWRAHYSTATSAMFFFLFLSHLSCSHWTLALSSHCSLGVALMELYVRLLDLPLVKAFLFKH